MSIAHLLPNGWHREWVLRLEHARAYGDLEACLNLRREDAKYSGLSERTLHLALAEERDWHATHQHHIASCTGHCTGLSPQSPSSDTNSSTSS